MTALTAALHKNAGEYFVPTLSATSGLPEPPLKPRQAAAQFRPPAVAVAHITLRDTAPTPSTESRGRRTFRHGSWRVHRQVSRVGHAGWATHLSWRSSGHPVLWRGCQGRRHRHRLCLPLPSGAATPRRADAAAAVLPRSCVTAEFAAAARRVVWSRPRAFRAACLPDSCARFCERIWRPGQLPLTAAKMLYVCLCRPQRRSGDAVELSAAVTTASPPAGFTGCEVMP